MRPTPISVQRLSPEPEARGERECAPLSPPLLAIIAPAWLIVVFGLIAGIGTGSLGGAHDLSVAMWRAGGVAGFIGGMTQ